MRASDPREDTARHLPLFLREGDSIPDGIDPARIIWIKRVYVDPPERAEEALPETQPAEDVFGADTRRPKRFNRPLEHPNLGTLMTKIETGRG